MCGKEKKKSLKKPKQLLTLKRDYQPHEFQLDTDEEHKGRQLSVGKQPGLVENGLLKHTG